MAGVTEEGQRAVPPTEAEMGREVAHCYFCFQAADKQLGKYDLCVPCHYKFEDAIDGLVLEILERASFREVLMKRST